MNYEDTEACKLLATHCAVCARPLVDAKSVELGIGPVCRDKYGFDLDMPEEVRKEANQIVYHIAADQKGEHIPQLAKQLANLGFEKLADRILERIARVRIDYTEDKSHFIVVMPGFSGMGAAMRNAGCPGKFDMETKTWKIKRTPFMRKTLWVFFRQNFGGHVGLVVPTKTAFAIEGV